MIKLFSSMLAKETYRPMSVMQHSILRASEDLLNVDIDTIGLSQRTSINMSIGYAFTDRSRKNVLSDGRKYSGTKTFQEIYERLTELNNGEPFIERYFDTLFKGKFESTVRKQSRALLRKIDEELAYLKSKNSGVRYKNKLDNFAAWKDQQLEEGFDQISADIKRHIQQCLATGRIPLNFYHSSATVKRRRQLGLTPVRAFFATGQLIDNLIISYTAEWAKG